MTIKNIISKSALASSILIASSFAINSNAADTKASTGNTKAALSTKATSTKATSNQVDLKQVSYVIGYNIGKSFHESKIKISKTQFYKGMNQGIAGKDASLTEAQMRDVMINFQKHMVEQKAKKDASDSKKNSEASSAYMAKVAKMPGVKKIEDGLYYQVLKAGKGPMPKATDTVVVNYEGKLPNNKVFDSSYKRGTPASFPVNQVIPGWTKALVKMPVGSTWRLYIAPNLAYGKFAPPSIGPNQALTFKVDLIKIK